MTMNDLTYANAPIDYPAYRIQLPNLSWSKWYKHTETCLEPHALSVQFNEFVGKAEQEQIAKYFTWPS